MHSLPLTIEAALPQINKGWADRKMSRELTALAWEGIQIGRWLRSGKAKEVEPIRQYLQTLPLDKLTRLVDFFLLFEVSEIARPTVRLCAKWPEAIVTSPNRNFLGLCARTAEFLLALIEDTYGLGEDFAGDRREYAHKLFWVSYPNLRIHPTPLLPNA